MCRPISRGMYVMNYLYLRACRQGIENNGYLVMCASAKLCRQCGMHTLCITCNLIIKCIAARCKNGLEKTHN